METKTTVSESQVRKLLARQIERSGGVRALAREWDLSPTVISMTSNGHRRPGPAILARLGIVATSKVSRRVVYHAAS